MPLFRLYEKKKNYFLKMHKKFYSIFKYVVDIWGTLYKYYLESWYLS